jgi:saccharopine dehydrogenase-like NADP-dependent oxidoreductase
MTKTSNIIIAGAGGIAQAASLMLAEWSEVPLTIYIGNRTLANAEKVAQWVRTGTTEPGRIETFHLTPEEISPEMEAILQKCDILLDCLPGNLAPALAGLANRFQLHYANLTEYVAETEAIKSLAREATTGFVLQTGLAPGYIDVLAHHLYQQFCRDYRVVEVDKLEMKVGALTLHAVAPHYYGFTWSPVGVATEYLKDTLVLRDFEKKALPALSQRSQLIINGILYEDDLTSGGAADLPYALAGKVRHLDYKTLRHPGHYAWVKDQLQQLGEKSLMIEALQQKMEAVIPHLEDDQVILYAAVEGRDSGGILRRREMAGRIRPMMVGKYRLRAIQTTTAASLLQVAHLLLESPQRGVILQSQIDPEPFLNGKFIRKVYGELPDRRLS